MNGTLTINTDGSCLGNPGPGGYAAILEWDGNILTVSGGDPSTTNNRMELRAVIEGLKASANIPGLDANPVTVRTDSQYVCNAFLKGWLRNWKRNGWRNSKGPLPNLDLWRELEQLTQGRQIRWEWVRGHSGDPRNEKCDALAVEQAELARRLDKPWVSVGTPKSRASGHVPEITEPEITGNPGPETSYRKDTLLEYNYWAATCAELALLRYEAGLPGEAWEVMNSALEKLSLQRAILESLDAL